MTPSSDNDANRDNWSEYRRLVLNELERLDQALTRLAETMLIHERGTMSYREEIIDRINKAKDSALESIREMIKATKEELEEKEDQDILRLHDRINAVEGCTNRIHTELKVLKGKAALLGFLAGLIVAVVSLLIKYFERSNG